MVPFVHILKVALPLVKRSKGEWTRLSDESVLLQIEELRRELNERYKQLSAITPELLELSVKLDRLLNKLYLHP
jgi:hypothetical protein